MDELDDIEKRHALMRNSREVRSRLPVDSHSQLDTGYTGRPDTDIAKLVVTQRAKRDRQIAAILRSKNREIASRPDQDRAANKNESEK